VAVLGFFHVPVDVVPDLPLIRVIVLVAALALWEVNIIDMNDTKRPFFKWL
jgi:hypothetical protein